MNRIHERKFDISKNEAMEEINIRQGDINTNTILIRLLNQGEPMALKDLDIILVYKTPQGEIIKEKNIEIEDNTLTATISEVITGLSGIIACQIVIKNPDKQQKLLSNIFFIRSIKTIRGRL